MKAGTTAAHRASVSSRPGTMMKALWDRDGAVPFSTEGRRAAARGYGNGMGGMGPVGGMGIGGIGGGVSRHGHGHGQGRYDLSSRGKMRPGGFPDGHHHRSSFRYCFRNSCILLILSILLASLILPDKSLPARLASALASWSTRHLNATSAASITPPLELGSKLPGGWIPRFGFPPI